MPYEPRLPSAVAEQGSKADELMASLAKGETVEAVQDPGAGEKPVEKPEEKPVEAAQPKAGDVVSLQEHQALQHKHSVLEGKYNSETSELRRSLGQAHQTIDRQNQMILDLHNRVKQLEGAGNGTGAAGAGGTEPKPEQKAPNAVSLKKLNPEDFQGYGAEMADLINGFNVLIEENQNLKGKVASTEKADEDRAWTDFTRGLAGIVPDWEVLNYDKDFIAYLAGFDLETDVLTRQQKLNHFVSQGDFQKAAKIFNAYKTGRSSAQSPKEEKLKKEDLIQPTPSAGSGDAPVKSQEAGDVTAEQYRQATQDYIQKRISYEEFEKISNAFQRTLARQTKK